MTSMGLWDDIKRIFKREATDVKEGLTKFGREIDAELARKERELEATPAERVDMLVEDMDAAEAHMDEIEAKVRGEIAGDQEIADPTSAAPAPAAAETPPERPRVQLLEAADVSSAPHIETALGWVTAQEFDPGDAMRSRFDHSIWIDEQVGPLVGDEVLEGIASEVADHVLVEEALHEDREQLYVRAPQLHSEDVRLLVAAAFADHIPDDWADRLGGTYDQ
jgi:hypothetical protein